MDYKELIATVKKSRKKAYFVYGQDEQLIFEVRNALRDLVLDSPDSMNHIKLDGTKVTADEMMDALSTYSMFAGNILVEVSKCTFMEKEAGNMVAVRELIADYLLNPRDDLYFFGSYKYENELEKKNFYLDSLKKKIGEKSLVEPVDPVKQKGVSDFVEDYLKKNQVAVDKPLVTYISESFKGSLLQLEKDIDKLIAYTQGRSITKADINKVMTISDERHIMNLLDLIFTERGIGRNVKEILNLLNDLLYRGEKPEMVIGLIGSRLRLLFGIKPLREAKKPMTEVASYLKTSSAWYAERMAKISDAISYKEYSRLFKVLLEAELTLKSSSVDTGSLLEVLVLSICDTRG